MTESEVEFLNSIEQYQPELDFYQKSHACSDGVKVSAIKAIWDKFAPSVSLQRFGNARSIHVPVDLACGTCISAMFNEVINWRRIVTSKKQSEVAQTYFKGVPDKTKAKVIEVAPKESGVYYNINDIESVKNALTKSDIKFHHKMKLPKLLQLLNESK